MRWLLACLIFCSVLAHAAPQGTYLGSQVADNGWQLWLYFQTLQTNGTFVYGLGPSNNVTGNEKVVVAFRSQGFRTDGSPTTYWRTNYGTMRVRLPTPNQANPDVSTNTLSETLVKVALAEPICIGDSNLVLNLGAGFYTDPNAAANLAAANMPVTNNSTLLYPKASGNWLYPGNNQWTNTGSVRAFGYQQLAGSVTDDHTNGQPLACAYFVYRGATSGFTVTNVETRLVLHSGALSHPASKFGNYSNIVSMTGFTHGEAIRCDAFFVPQVGTTNEIATTWNNTHTFPTPRLIAITNLCDKNGTYGGQVAMFGPGGTGAGGRARRYADPLSSTAYNDRFSTPSEWFATAAQCNDAIAASNNLHALPTHNDSGGGYIYSVSNTFAFAGSTVTIANKPLASVTLVNHPSFNVAINADTGTDDLNDRVRIMSHPDGGSFTIASTTTQIPFSSMDQLVLERVILDSTGSGPIQATTTWLIDSTTPNFTQGLRPVGNGNHNWLITGCNLTGLNTVIMPYLFVGNYHASGNGSNYTLVSDLAGQTAAQPDGMIWYNYQLMGMQNNSSVFMIGKNFSISNSFANIQFILEAVTNNINPITSLTFDFGSTIGFNYTNKVSAYGMAGGARDFIDYLDVGTVNYFRIWSTYINDYFDEPGVKTDVFGTPSANRVGNWMTVWGSGSMGNLNAQTFGISISFTWEFPGIGSLNYSSQQSPYLAQFYDSQRYDGTKPFFPGNGVYRTLARAPQNGNRKTFRWQLPFDIAGQPRTRANNGTGPYVIHNQTTIGPGTPTVVDASGGTTTLIVP